MYNIKKAVSRLDFAPKLDEIKVTDIKRGLGVFRPKPDKPVSFAALKTNLKKAGYTLASAEITVAGMLAREGSELWIEADISKQRFALEGESANRLLAGIDAGARLEVTGDWQTAGQDASAREVIHPRAVKALPPSKVSSLFENHLENHDEKSGLESIQVSLNGLGSGSRLFRAPVRTTSPGLTVYKGGAFTPRYFFIREHLGSLGVNRHMLSLDASYTPTPTLQLEVEVPYQQTSFEDGARSGSASGLGNVIVWGKYRFYRALETWGDRQAALRFGLELPTGKKSAPGEDKPAAPEFVRQQLGSIDGGTTFHTDVSYSQAHARFIYGANIQGTLRDRRDGFRTGHELRVNTDLEYVLLPLKYRSPGKELFAIMETTYSHRSRGQIAGRTVPGSSSSEFYLAPGFQFTASPRVVLEASFQFPVIMNAGPLVLRTDKNFLVGLRYLY